jgi:hypothetical protein
VTPGDERDRVADAFRRVADAVGGSYDRTFHSNRPVVQKRDRDWIVTLAWELLEQGTFVTVVRAPFHNPAGVRFAIRDERLFDNLLETLGFVEDLEVGERVFDRRFVVRGFPGDAVREVFDARVRELLQAQESVDLRAAPGALYTRYPAGVDELHFREPGALVDPERLIGLFELFEELLPRLRGVGPHSNDLELDLQRLAGPGGRVPLMNGPLLLWDGDAPRRDAAARLGGRGDPRAVEPLVAVLGDDDEGIVAAAARALARIADRRAVPALVALLGQRRRKAGDSTLGDVARQALERLGEAELGRAFERALEGDPEPLRAAAGEHREAVVEALVAVVDSVDFTARVEAARALGELGATEALPLLRAKSSAWGMRTRLTEAAAEAVEKIEARAGLPRPARSAPEGPDTHPRPADGIVRDDSTLPRPAEGEGEGDKG